MSDNEVKLLYQLCGDEETVPDAQSLKYITPEVLGYLFSNRLAAYVYWKLKKQKLLQFLSSSVESLLREAYMFQKEKHKSYKMAIKLLANALGKNNCRYALINDAVMCTVYPEATRTGDEIDLLMTYDEFQKNVETLCQYGFRQGTIDFENVMPVFMKNTCQSKNSYTATFVKHVDLPWIPCVRVNIRVFDLPNMIGCNTLQKLMGRLEHRTKEDLTISTFEIIDYIIYQCVCLLHSIIDKNGIYRDHKAMLHIYKDIALMFSQISSEETQELFCRAEELEVLGVCITAFDFVSAFIPINNATARIYIDSEKAKV